jgi:hypothetical protein
LQKELQPWVKTFPDEYYAQLFRFRGLEFPRDAVKGPQYFGTLTNDIVTSASRPACWKELKKVIPETESGRRADPLKLRQKLHQIFFAPLLKLFPGLQIFLGVAAMRPGRLWGPEAKAGIGWCPVPARTQLARRRIWL